MLYFFIYFIDEQKSLQTVELEYLDGDSSSPAFLQYTLYFGINSSRQPYTWFTEKAICYQEENRSFRLVPTSDKYPNIIRILH